MRLYWKNFKPHSTASLKQIATAGSMSLTEIGSRLGTKPFFFYPSLYPYSLPPVTLGQGASGTAETLVSQIGKTIACESFTKASLHCCRLLFWVLSIHILLSTQVRTSCNQKKLFFHLTRCKHLLYKGRRSCPLFKMKRSKVSTVIVSLSGRQVVLATLLRQFLHMSIFFLKE